MLERQKSGVRVYALRLFTIQVSLPATMSIQSKPDINIFMTVKPAAFLHIGVVQLKQYYLHKPDESNTPLNNCYEHKVSAYNHVFYIS